MEWVQVAALLLGGGTVGVVVGHIVSWLIARQKQDDAHEIEMVKEVHATMIEHIEQLNQANSTLSEANGKLNEANGKLTAMHHESIGRVFTLQKNLEETTRAVIGARKELAEVKVAERRCQERLKDLDKKVDSALAPRDVKSRTRKTD